MSGFQRLLVWVYFISKIGILLLINLIVAYGFLYVLAGIAFWKSTLVFLGLVLFGVVKPLGEYRANKIWTL